MPRHVVKGHYWFLLSWASKNFRINIYRCYFCLYMIASVPWSQMFILHLQDRTASNIKLLYLKQLASRKAKPLWIINLCIWFLTVFRVRSQHWNVVVSARPLFLACGFGCLVSCIFCVFIHYCNCPTPRRPFGALHQVSNIHTVPQYWIGLSLLWILPQFQTLNSSSYLTAPVLKLLAVCSYLCVTLFNAVYFCVEV